MLLLSMNDRACAVRKLNRQGSVWHGVVCLLRATQPARQPVNADSCMGVLRDSLKSWEKSMPGTPMYVLCCDTCCLPALKCPGWQPVKSLHRIQPWLRPVGGSIALVHSCSDCFFVSAEPYPWTHMHRMYVPCATLESSLVCGPCFTSRVQAFIPSHGCMHLSKVCRVRMHLITRLAHAT